jgi:putative sporulation protein YyaC
MNTMLQYFKPGEQQSLLHFTDALYTLLQKQNYENREIVLICIGSDRATGDSLGPIVGQKLRQAKLYPEEKNFHVFGTLEKPVHAKNLEASIRFIHRHYPGALTIAVDASLGMASHVGYITLGEGSLCPGVGVDKNLPSVGDIFITGIVNLSGFASQMLLQTTHLHLVMQLAEFISMGICRCLYRSKLRPTLQCAE